MTEQPGTVTSTRSESMTFAEIAHAITRAGAGLSLYDVHYRAPCRIEGQVRSIRKDKHGPGHTISVNIHGRNPEAVAADMIEGFMRAHARIDDPALFGALHDAAWAVIHPEDK